MSAPALKTTLKATFDEAMTQVTEALKAEGFGVLTEIDVQKTLKQKIDVDVRRYQILGACNPALAHKALQIDPLVGLMMPCNVVLYEGETAGVVEVLAINANEAAKALGNPALEDFAVQVTERLDRALKSLG